MTPKDFHIGLEFWCGGKLWRCTDVGSRVVVAISLEPHEVVSLGCDLTDPAKHIKRRYMTDDPAWFNGPPYAVVEQVFDEDSLEACSLTNGERPDDAPMSDAEQQSLQAIDSFRGSGPKGATQALLEDRQADRIHET
ncbi:MAG: hypothetical protein WCI11_00065 [Candidatus Methylumidiphilus sp.]